MLRATIATTAAPLLVLAMTMTAVVAALLPPVAMPIRMSTTLPTQAFHAHQVSTLMRAPSGRKPSSGPRDEEDDGAVNPGSNLFVTGIHPRLTEGEISKMFEKYGDVEKCQIMRDPHSKESRGFGFVKMVTPEQAEAAKEGLQGEQFEGRTLSIEKARRAKPRTPTPGKYFGPPKRGKLKAFPHTHSFQSTNIS